MPVSAVLSRGPCHCLSPGRREDHLGPLGSADAGHREVPWLQGVTPGGVGGGGQHRLSLARFLCDQIRDHFTVCSTLSYKYRGQASENLPLWMVSWDPSVCSIHFGLLMPGLAVGRASSLNPTQCIEGRGLRDPSCGKTGLGFVIKPGTVGETG